MLGKDIVKKVLEDALLMSEADVLLVVTDKATREIGEAFYLAGNEIGKAYMTLIEDWGERPMTSFPWALDTYVDIIKPTVTVYAASVQPGELPFRKGFVNKALSLGARHGHMPGVTWDVLNAARDPKKVESITLEVYEKVKDAKEIHVTSSSGTELFVEVGKYCWVPDTGIIREGWGNIPGGEVFTTPTKVEGTLVVEEIGDYFSKKYGRIKPTKLVIENSELVDAEGEVGKELFNYLDKYSSGRNVGEFAIGTNVFVERLLGILLHDEKHPGVHVAFGDPLGHHTGAEWTCDVHVDALALNVDVYVDGELIMKGGKLLGGC